MPYLTVPHRITRRIPIPTAATSLRINNGTTTTGTITNFITKRKTAPTTTATPAPAYENPAPALDPVTGLPDNGDLPDVSSRVALYLHDHLGNTRVTFRADAPDAIAIDFAADYYPYGKILRSYELCSPNRFLSTHHERDAATGYDNRGARLYDSEIGRFLGVDPLASKFPGWSPYNYVMGNPVSLIDPDGRSAEDPPHTIGWSKMTYTLNEDNSHILTYQSEVHTYSDDHVETTVTQQTINLSPEGEILSSNESKEVFQSAIIGERTVMNPLDGMVVTTPKTDGERVLMSSYNKGEVPICDLSCDAQDVVGLIQDRTKTNQRYDLFKESAAEYNFGSALVMGALGLRLGHKLGPPLG